MVNLELFLQHLHFVGQFGLILEGFTFYTLLIFGGRDSPTPSSDAGRDVHHDTMTTLSVCLSVCLS